MSRQVTTAEIVDADGRRVRVEIDLAESPLGWLRSRKAPDGSPLIDDAAVVAGERLRADYEKAVLVQRTTMNWQGLAAGSERRRGGGGLDIPDMALAARDRFEAALEAVGPDLAGVLVDVCCLGRPLQDVERSRGWPARSGKLMLTTALAALARHYGYAGTAGRGRGPIRQWGTTDYRPKS